MMGSDKFYPEEKPLNKRHYVFWMDKCPLMVVAATNCQLIMWRLQTIESGRQKGVPNEESPVILMASCISAYSCWLGCIACNKPIIFDCLITVHEQTRFWGGKKTVDIERYFAKVGCTIGNRTTIAHCLISYMDEMVFWTQACIEMCGGGGT